MGTDENAKRTLLESIRSGSLSAFMNIYNKAFMSLIASDVPVTDDNCPETFMLDSYRLFLFQLEFKQLVFSSTIIMTIANLLPATSVNFKVTRVCVCNLGVG